MSDAPGAGLASPLRVFTADGGVERWQAPSLGAEPRVAADPAKAAAAHAQWLAEVEDRARADGYRRGYQEGREAGLAELTRQAERLSELAAALVPQSRLLDDRLLEQLRSLVVAAIRQFVRRELSMQPGEIVRVLREAVSVLPAADAELRLHLHPDDAALVAEALHPQDLDRPWRVKEDLAVSRGGLRVETDVSTVDATVEARMSAVLARLLSDERRPVAGDRERTGE